MSTPDPKITDPKEQSWKTIQQMADRYQVSMRTIANMMEDGRLPYYKIGRVVRFNLAECDRALRAFRRASQFGDDTSEDDSRTDFP